MTTANLPPLPEYVTPDYLADLKLRSGPALASILAQQSERDHGDQP